jgi:hypothetical protein
MSRDSLNYYLLDTPDLLIEKALIWRSEFTKSLYDKGVFYGFCCAMAKLYREISNCDLITKLSVRAQNFNPEKLITDLKLPTCSQEPPSIKKSRDNFLFSILSELLCNAIDLRDRAIREQNSWQDDWLRGQYFGHYSVITTMVNQVMAFELFDMLPDSWGEFDPDTLHNGLKKSDLGL